MSLFHARTFLLEIFTASLAAIPTLAAPKATPTPTKPRVPVARKTPLPASSTKPPSAVPNDPDSMEAYLRLSQNAVPFRRAADEALQHLRAGRIDALMARMSPAMLVTNGGAAPVRAVLKRDIAPFFAGYKKLGSSETVRPAADEYGNHGFSFYLSRIGKDGQEKPFVIYIMREKNRLVVANVVPNWKLQQR